MSAERQRTFMPSHVARDFVIADATLFVDLLDV